MGLRDRGRCGVNPLCPSYLLCALPHKCWFQPSFLAAMQSRVQVISQDSPLDGSTSREALIDTWPCCNKTTPFPSDLGARIETAVTQYGNLFRETLIGTSHVIIIFFPILQHFVPALWSGPGADWSDIKLRQSTDNISCLSHLPARGGCVCLCLSVCVCECVWNLLVSLLAVVGLSSAWGNITQYLQEEERDASELSE